MKVRLRKDVFRWRRNLGGGGQRKRESMRGLEEEGLNFDNTINQPTSSLLLFFQIHLHTDQNMLQIALGYPLLNSHLKPRGYLHNVLGQQ